MYASNLEQLLFELIANADASRTERAKVTKRFDTLRSFGRLPRGRANHAALLSDEHIASAILGLATDTPSWAGHVSIVLGNLVPVGGSSASVNDAATLNQFVQQLLIDQSARKTLITLTITSAEVGVNSNGSARATFKNADGEKAVSFVSRLAYSLLQPGSENTYDHDRQFSPAARLFSFNPKFFAEIARQTADIRTRKPKPLSDGNEYKGEEAERRRLAKLGVQRGSRYLTIGVDNQVTWPREATLIKFDEYSMVLLPKTKEDVQSINLDLTANKLTIKQARTVINRFLSIMTWCDDQFAVAQDGWAGNPIPSPVSRRDLAFTTAHYWIFDRKIPSDPDAMRALALYREGRNAEQNFLISYAVLSFYKIIEIKYPSGPQNRSWISSAFPSIEPTIRTEVAHEFHRERGSKEPARHIYDAYRLAVAHASARTISDPDCAEELNRLHIAADVLRMVARHFISTELRVSDCLYSGD